MNKILLRILLGLVTVISVLGLFSLSVVKVSNDVRLEHHWFSLAQPPLNYIRTHGLDFGNSSPVSISKKPFTEKASDSFIARLRSGQVLVSIVEQQINVWIGIKDQVILLESDLQGDAIYELYGWLISSQINNAIAETSADSLLGQKEGLSKQIESLSNSLNVEILKVQDTHKLSSQRLLNELVENGFYTIMSGGDIQSFIQLKSGEIYEIRFSEYYSPYSVWVILCLLIFSSSVLTAIAFTLIQNFDRRIRGIETAASRIARGELDARVSRAGDEDATSRLGTAFNSMADHIQRLMYVQKEMIHAVSHELRTPVARIRFGVQMIADSFPEETIQKQVQGIDGDIQELDELIDEILTYARLEQGGPILAFHEADVEAIVEQVVSEQGGVKPDLEIFSEYKKGSKAWKMSEIEARYIHRSIQNLVGNATRYSNGRVKVVCVFDSDTCRVDVEDDGPGIPEENWESVFTPFARLDDSRTRSSGGYGLGLSIVRRILYWHGGQAFLGRSEMGGAKFSLVWPRKQTKL